MSSQGQPVNERGELLTVQYTKEELEQGLKELQAKRNPLQGLAVGRIVHYVLESGRCKGEYRPAIIVRIFEAGRATGMVNMQVFTDGLNDGFHEVHVFHLKNDEKHEFHQAVNTLWRTSVHYSETKEPGTWHWPERA